MPAPNARVDIENVELTIPGISLELYFRKASKMDCRQQALRRLNDLRRVYRLHISAELTKISGELTRAPCHDGGQGASVFTKSGIRELCFASSRHHLLDDQGFRGE